MLKWISDPVVWISTGVGAMFMNLALFSQYFQSEHYICISITAGVMTGLGLARLKEGQA